MAPEIKGIFFDLTRVIQFDPYWFWFLISDLKFKVRPGISRLIFLDNEEEEKRDSVNLDDKSKKEILHYLRFKKRLNKSLIKKIKELSNKYKIGIISNHAPNLEKRMKENMKIDHRFDLVISSGDVGVQKPSPKIYEIAIKRFKINPSQLIYIDDNPNYVKAAESFGMKGIIYKNFSDLSRLLISILSQSKN